MTPLVLLLPAGGLVWALWKAFGDDLGGAPRSPSLAASGSAPPPKDAFQGIHPGYDFGADPKALPAARAAKLAQALNLTPSIVQAIATVESRGDDAAIRFEPHLYVKKRPDLRQGAVRPDGSKGIVPYTPTSEKKPWDSNPDHTGRKAFEVAFALDRQAALESTSFGRFQVMGTWLNKVYPDPLQAFQAWRADPAALSDALLIAWFKGNKDALEAARRRDWATLARIYNGPGRVDTYKRLLADAHTAAGGEPIA